MPEGLTGIPGKPFKVLRNSGIPQDFESAGSGILQKLQLSFLEILKFLGTQFSVVHGGGGDIFWNSPIGIDTIHPQVVPLLVDNSLRRLEELHSI